jgi:hypothetical protein
MGITWLKILLGTVLFTFYQLLVGFGAAHAAPVVLIE